MSVMVTWAVANRNGREPVVVFVAMDDENNVRAARAHTRRELDERVRRMGEGAPVYYREALAQIDRRSVAR